MEKEDKQHLRQYATLTDIGQIMPTLIAAVVPDLSRDAMADTFTFAARLATPEDPQRIAAVYRYVAGILRSPTPVCPACKEESAFEQADTRASNAASVRRRVAGSLRTGCFSLRAPMIPPELCMMARRPVAVPPVRAGSTYQAALPRRERGRFDRP